MSDLDRLYTLLTQRCGIARRRDRRLEQIAHDRAYEARWDVGTSGSTGIPHPINQLKARTWPLQGSFKGVWENAAWNYGYADPVQAAVDGWWNSDAHRANLLNTNATDWGIGIHREPVSGEPNRWYFITIFTRPLLMRVYVATGENFPDALGAGPVASQYGTNVLLVKASTVPLPTQQALARLRPSEVVVLGGPSVVSDSVVNWLRTNVAPTRRLSGADRYATAALLAAE